MATLESSGLTGINDQTSVSTGPDSAFTSRHRLVTVDHGRFVHCSLVPKHRTRMAGSTYMYSLLTIDTQNVKVLLVH